MPQNNKVNPGTTGTKVPSTTNASSPIQEYRKEKKLMAKRGGPMNKIVNPNFSAALPGMIRNIEGIVAAKANQANSHIHLADIKERGEQEVKEKRKEMLKSTQRNKQVKKVLKKSRNAKGVRGEFDVEELAELSPELQKILVDQQQQKQQEKKLKQQQDIEDNDSLSNNNKKKTNKKRPRTEDNDGDNDNSNEEDDDNDTDDDNNESNNDNINEESANSNKNNLTSIISHTKSTTLSTTSTNKRNIKQKGRSTIDIGKTPDDANLFNTEASIAAEFGADFL